MSIGMKTNIRSAVSNDIPYLINLHEIEYNLYQAKDVFSPDITEKYIHTMMIDPDAVLMVITDFNQIPFGYLAGTIDHITLSLFPVAISHHWFVNNPKSRYGRGNYGLHLLQAFEKWAKLRGALHTMIGIRQKAGERKTYDKTFNKMGYVPSTMYYKKRIQ